MKLSTVVHQMLLTNTLDREIYPLHWHLITLERCRASKSMPGSERISVLKEIMNTHIFKVKGKSRSQFLKRFWCIGSCKRRYGWSAARNYFVFKDTRLSNSTQIFSVLQKVFNVFNKTKLSFSLLVLKRPKSIQYLLP